MAVDIGGSWWLSCIKSSFSVAATLTVTVYWTTIIDGFAAAASQRRPQRGRRANAAICRCTVVLAPVEAALPPTIRLLVSEWDDLSLSGQCAMKCQLVTGDVQVSTSPGSILLGDAGRALKTQHRPAHASSAYLRRNADYHATDGRWRQRGDKLHTRRDVDIRCELHGRKTRRR